MANENKNTAHWIDVTSELWSRLGLKHYQCSACKADTGIKTKECFACGTKMDEVQE